MRRRLATITAPLSVVACVLGAGCHREVDVPPLPERTIYVTDRFYDVQALTKDRAFVVGYGGKILETTDGGLTWTKRDSGTELALYDIHMADDRHGWIAGQEALILRTEDGGVTWTRQESNALFEDPREPGVQQKLYLFGLWALDKDRAWAVGDRSVLVSTTDGGKTWTASKVPMELDLSGGQSLAAADPILYDVAFTDPQTGWVVGEFGKILHTSDGGATWREQEKSLMEGTGIIDLLDLPSLFGLHMKSAREGLAAGLEGHVARTTDGGATWRYDPTEVDVPLLDPLFRIVELPDGNAWAVGAAGEVLRRQPGEAAWKRAKLGQDVLTWLRGISFSDPQHGWMVGGFGLIYRTTDGGKSWLPSQG